jgi:hypothetical protein
MMTTTTPSHGDAFHHPKATASHGDAPQPASCLPPPEWMPLDGIAQTWAAFGAEASSPAALQATGTAFLALALEASAHQNYGCAARSYERGNTPSLAYTQGIEHTLAELDEASQEWKCVLLWLDSLARETRQPAELPLTPEQLPALVRAQQQRVLSLFVRVQREYLDAHHEPLLLYVRHLPTPAAAEKARQP